MGITLIFTLKNVIEILLNYYYQQNSFKKILKKLTIFIILSDSCF